MKLLRLVLACFTPHYLLTGVLLSVSGAILIPQHLLMSPISASTCWDQNHKPVWKREAVSATSQCTYLQAVYFSFHPRLSSTSNSGSVATPNEESSLGAIYADTHNESPTYGQTHGWGTFGTTMELVFLTTETWWILLSTLQVQLSNARRNLSLDIAFHGGNAGPV